MINAHNLISLGCDVTDIRMGSFSSEHVSDRATRVTLATHVLLVYYAVLSTSLNKVSGDANFMMSSTQLTVGGFTQPGVARGLIEMPANAEKGFSHRFLWFFPSPLFEGFSSLGEVDRTFVNNIST